MEKNVKITIIVVLFVFLMIYLIYAKFSRENNSEIIEANQISSIFETIDKSNYAKITKYIIYGTHFNLEGKIEIPKISKIYIDSANIVLKNDDDEIPLETDYEYKDGTLSFSTIKKINDGISLENIQDSNYLFLKVIYSSSEVKYYSLINDTKYGDLTYYSFSKNKIDIKFENYNNIPYISINSSKIDNLPANVYDIVIDPSHGGSDSGARKGKNTESEIVLKCAKNLKKKLENLGYKVFLTRDGSEAPNADMSMNMYDDNGRINTAQESHAKLLISLNINDVKSSKGGVEVYAPTQCNLDFAKMLASNIVKKAKTNYSSSNFFKAEKGVYVRYFTKADIEVYKLRAKNGNYEPYAITTSTPYLYMIREIGGIATNAFIDGRNKYYGKNKYLDSNVGIEGYSIELGYMSVQKDLNNIIKNQDLYMDGIATAIKNCYK